MSKKFDFYPQFMALLSALIETYKISGIALFVLCVLSASNMLSRIRMDIETGGHIKTSKDISKWKNTHALVCLFVESINRCFGSLLLIDSASNFLRIIMSAFQGLEGFRKNEVSRFSILQIMHTLVLFFLFWVMCIVAGRLPMKVSTLNGAHRFSF